MLRNSVGHFTSKHLRLKAVIGSHVSDEAVCHIMRKDSLRYRHARKTGLLRQKDVKERLVFARKVRRELNANHGRRTFHSTVIILDKVF